MWSFAISSGTVVREEVGLALDKVGREVLGTAAKIEISKDNTTIVGDGSTEEAVRQRVAQIKRQMEVGFLYSETPDSLRRMSASQKVCWKRSDGLYLSRGGRVASLLPQSKALSC